MVVGLPGDSGVYPKLPELLREALSSPSSRKISADPSRM